jgi:UDP-N-acetylmuramoyl-tripeptide--D-alanyl-D-alanine ligase
MRLSMGEVASLLGASCGAPGRLVSGYSIDSRSIPSGALFFAIHGKRFDGHQFVGPALERGAAGAVVERAFRDSVPATLTPLLIAVEDTTRALQDLALAVRRKWGRQVVAVTGSAGKTTTKELIATLLAKRFRVHKSAGNLNNHYGVPLTLLNLEPAHEVAVVEVAMAAPGEIARLAEIAEPETGVVTNVAPVHLEFFDSLDAIARAKRELIENLKPPATAILNYDDPRVRAFREHVKGRVVTFGFEAEAEFRATGFRPYHYPGRPETGTLFQMRGPAAEAEFYVPLPGRHNVENALAAIAAASAFEVPWKDLWTALWNFRPPEQRAEVVKLPLNVILLNDSYNSNPRAMEKMLETLAAWPDRRQRIVVAGEMLELGPSSPELHREIGRKCAASSVDWLLAVQGDARFFLEGAVEAGLPAQRAYFFQDPEEAGKFCRTLLQPDDLVLVKGSRAVHLEKVTELLQSLCVRAKP